MVPTIRTIEEAAMGEKQKGNPKDRKLKPKRSVKEKRAAKKAKKNK
jgi:hypothetical protein